MATLDERSKRRQQAKARAISGHMERRARVLPPKPVYTHAVKWNGRILTHHTSEQAAVDARDDKLKARTETVKLMFPPNRCKCDKIDGAHTMADHHSEHIGLFEVVEYVPPSHKFPAT